MRIRRFSRGRAKLPGVKLDVAAIEVDAAAIGPQKSGELPVDGKTVPIA